MMISVTTPPIGPTSAATLWIGVSCQQITILISAHYIIILIIMNSTLCYSFCSWTLYIVLLLAL